LERESAVKGWRGKGKENAKEKEAAFSPGWHGRGGLADGRGPPGVEETRTRRTTTEPHRESGTGQAGALPRLALRLRIGIPFTE